MLLAGVPVLGTLLLSVLVVLEVQQRAQAAAGFGSIENLAQLTDKMLHVIRDLQWERAEVAYAAGGAKDRRREIAERRRHTDDALVELDALLDERDVSKLPQALSQSLNAANEQLSRLAEVRASAEQDGFVVLDYLDYFSSVNDSLIGATAEHVGARTAVGLGAALYLLTTVAAWRYLAAVAPHRLANARGAASTDAPTGG